MAKEPTSSKGASVPSGDAQSAAAAGKRKKPLVSTRVAVGIGSAAIVAALLYASRNRKTD